MAEQQPPGPEITAGTSGFTNPLEGLTPGTEVHDAAPDDSAFKAEFDSKLEGAGLVGSESDRAERQHAARQALREAVDGLTDKAEARWRARQERHEPGVVSRVSDIAPTEDDYELRFTAATAKANIAPFAAVMRQDAAKAREAITGMSGRVSARRDERRRAKAATNSPEPGVGAVVEKGVAEVVDQAAGTAPNTITTQQTHEKRTGAVAEAAAEKQREAEQAKLLKKAQVRATKEFAQENKARNEKLMAHDEAETKASEQRKLDEAVKSAKDKFYEDQYERVQAEIHVDHAKLSENPADLVGNKGDHEEARRQAYVADREAAELVALDKEFYVRRKQIEMNTVNGRLKRMMLEDLEKSRIDALNERRQTFETMQANTKTEINKLGIAAADGKEAVYTLTSKSPNYEAQARAVRNLLGIADNQNPREKPRGYGGLLHRKANRGRPHEERIYTIAGMRGGYLVETIDTKTGKLVRQTVMVTQEDPTAGGLRKNGAEKKLADLRRQDLGRDKPVNNLANSDYAYEQATLGSWDGQQGKKRRPTLWERMFLRR